TGATAARETDPEFEEIRGHSEHVVAGGGFLVFDSSPPGLCVILKARGHDFETVGPGADRMRTACLALLPATLLAAATAIAQNQPPAQGRPRGATVTVRSPETQ